MNITFYLSNDMYINKVTNKKCYGVVQNLTFSQLVYNFRYPHEIDITLDELNSLSRSEHEIDRRKYLDYKDQGFFIGGTVDVATHSRKLEYILDRTLLTLDIDHPKEDVWAKFKAKFPNLQGIKYTTIRHTSSAPRYRILIPLSEPVQSEGFDLLSRYIALELGDDNFDKTTHDISRVMFIPTITAEGEYDFDFQNGEPLDIVKYIPIARENITTAMPRTAQAEYKSPLEKAGVVGAFNRAYPVTEAIEHFLSDIYLKGTNFDAHNPRYRYHLSTALPGARVYDGNTMFYSAHDKDPAVNKSLDAFNLVKIHKFDNDFQEMLEWAVTLDEVKSEMFQVSSAIKSPDSDANWVLNLTTNKQGQILDTLYNLQLIFLNDPNLMNIVTLNHMTYMIEIGRDIHASIDGAPDRKGKTLEDADVTDIRVYLETCSTPLKASKQNVVDTMGAIARLHGYHPVREYLNDLKDAWDGTPRIETMFTDYLMVEDSPIMRVISRKIMAASVMRIMKPGIKWEGVPVLHGVQGSGKSTFIQKLYKSSPFDTIYFNWVNPTAIDYSNVDKAIERTKMFWAIELAELASNTLSTFSNEQMKAFISADRPTTRVPYDKYPITFDRQMVFWGTTNVWLYISDQTGARRFLPIDVRAVTEIEKSTCLHKIHKMPVDQLWAEAMTYYELEPLYFSPEEEQLLNRLRAKHTEESGYQAVLYKFVNMKIPEDWANKSPLERRDYFQNGGMNDGTVDKVYISMSEIAYEALGRNLADMQRKAMRDIEITMFNLGWTVADYPRKTIYGQSKTFIRPGGAPDGHREPTD